MENLSNDEKIIVKGILDSLVGLNYARAKELLKITLLMLGARAVIGDGSNGES